ncbi:MAG: hypothetical protein QM756_16520 [Polyangiaceae bacterium]
MVDTSIEGTTRLLQQEAELLGAEAKKNHDAALAMLDERLAELPPDGRAAKELREARAEIAEDFEKRFASVPPAASGRMNPASVEPTGIPKDAPEQIR